MAYSAIGSFLVAEVDLVGDDYACFGEGVELLDVEALVTEAGAK